MKRWIPILVVVLAAAAMLAYGPIPQLRDYHAFADRRAWLGIPNAADVLSNLAFLAVALWGATRLPGARAALGDAWNGYGLFVVALALTAAGSGFYHWAPDNARLVFDRLPIALACAGLLAAVHAETLGAPQPRWVLPFLGAAAIASVLWWWRTESLGAGDLRPYLLLQGAPLVLIPLWQALHAAPRSRRVLYCVPRQRDLSRGGRHERAHLRSL